jgi:hypothetical protein
LLVSGHTRQLFSEFVSSYQSIRQNASSSTPFVYVDETGVKLIADTVQSLHGSDQEIFALSVAGDGWVELLSVYEG